MIFISYSRKMERWWIDKLLSHFRSIDPDFTDQNVWYDEDIQPGEKWNAVIEAKRNKARIAIMLVTAEYLGSNFIRNKEMDYFLGKENVIKYWFLVEDCPWWDTEFGQIQCANGTTDGSNLRPLVSNKEHVNTIFAAKCSEMHKIAKCLRNVHNTGNAISSKIYPHALIYYCNRNLESDLIAEGYKELTKRNKVICFASLMDEGDNFNNFSQTIKYKSLECAIGNEQHIVEVEIEDIDRCEIANKNLVKFICYMVKRLTGQDIGPEVALNYSIQQMYDTYAKEKGKNTIVYSIYIKSNKFHEEKFEPIIHWINNQFSKHNDCPLHVIFLFHLINGLSDTNNIRMKNAVLKKSVEVNAKNCSTIYKRASKTIFYLGEHSSVSREVFESWYSEHINTGINGQVNDDLKEIYYGYRDELFVADNKAATGYASAKVKVVHKTLKSFIGHINGIIAN